MNRSRVGIRTWPQPLSRLWSVGLMLLSVAALFPLQHSLAFARERFRGTDAPTFVYESTYNGANFDYGLDTVVDSGGNAYVLARSYDSNNDVLVLKFGPDGTLLWNTTIRGNALDFGTGIEVDGSGIVYITGWTDSTDFPLVNPLQSTRNGFRDAFLSKLSAQDGSIVYSTYFGGNRSDGSNDLAINSAGEVYLTGYTESTDFPTVNPIQGQLDTTTCFCADAFVSKISADGSTLLYSTYLGGSFDDEGRSIGIDAHGNIFVAGDTKSDDFPTTNPVQAAFAGGMRDVFAARISAGGSTLDYSTYLGGEDWDRVNRIAVDGAGYAYLSGTTRSVGFPTTPGAFQEQFAGGILACGNPPYDPLHNCDDVFVTKVAPDGSSLAYSTYLGGNRNEEGRGIAVDGSGQAHIVGYTTSPDFPPSGNLSAADIFVAELDSSGSALNYTVLVDSPTANAGHGIAVDSAGDIYITGAQNVPSDVYTARLSASAPPPANTLHVAGIEISGQDLGRNRYVIYPEVRIQDQDGDPLEGATVTIGITTPLDRYQVLTRSTDAQGIVAFKAQSRTGGYWEVCVTDIVRDGFSYVPSQNNETCDSIVFPDLVDNSPGSG